MKKYLILFFLTLILCSSQTTIAKDNITVDDIINLDLKIQDRIKKEWGNK